MAYTDPHDWSVSELLTASLFDTHIRDNLRWIGGGSTLASNEGRGTTIPTASLVEGMLFVYQADNTNGVEWLLKYNSSETTYKWRAVGGPPLWTEDTTSGSTASTSYTNTPGGPVSITVPVAGDYMIEVGALLTATNNGATGVTAYVSYDINGAGAADADAAAVQSGGNASVTKATTAHAVRCRRKTGLSASDVVTLKFRTSNASQSASIDEAWLKITPVRVV